MRWTASRLRSQPIRPVWFDERVPGSLLASCCLSHVCDDACMRTTVTIDPDLAVKLRRLARERGISFKDALNTSLRAGIGTDVGAARPYRLRARSLKLRPGIDLDRALRLATTLEDEEIVRKLELRK